MLAGRGGKTYRLLARCSSCLEPISVQSLKNCGFEKVSVLWWKRGEGQVSRERSFYSSGRER